MPKRGQELEILPELAALVGTEIPDEHVLVKLHHGLEELAMSAHTYIQGLDRQLDRLSKASTSISQEIQRREQDKAAKRDSQGADEPADPESEPPKSSPKSPQKKFVTNPKSEFVASQALPIDKLGLFQESSGDEGLLKKYGVVSYPKNDLLDMLPGEIPEEDFTRAKPPNQVQFTTFASFLEPYFRPFTNEDISFLEQSTIGSEVVSYGQSISPYIIPPLGPLYTENWMEEDGPQSAYHVAPPPQTADPARYSPLGSIGSITDDNLERGKLCLGPFSTRLVAAILPEDGETEDAVPSVASELPQPPAPPRDKHPYSSFAMLEERMRREFRYVGLIDVNILHKAAKNRAAFKLAMDTSSMFDDDLEIDWVNTTEDDEICRELRSLQQKLRKVSHANQKYKRRLLPLVHEQLAWQEYSSILDDLDKQVDQAYLRRLRAPKQKKKATSKPPVNGASAAPSPQPQTPTGIPIKTVDQKPVIKALLEKRQRWISKIGPVFPPPHLMMRSHEIPKFEGNDEDDEVEEGEEEE